MTLFADQTPASAPGPRHVVQFYERDEFLYTQVADFLAPGIAQGEPALVIATDEHRRGIAEALSSRGIDAAALTFADVRETLATFMRDGAPDADLFRTSIASLLGTGKGPVTAYGEMVDVLCRDGNPGAALRLEELWNGVGRDVPLSLLCAYPLDNFSRGTHAELFDSVCALHGSVVPTENYGGSADEERQREIARLQQRAAALEAEMEAGALLLDAVSALNRSLDPADRMRELADVVVPKMAAGCSIDLGGEVLTAGDVEGKPLALPLQVSERTIGTLTLHDARCHPDVALQLARHAATALENSRLYMVACDANRMKDEFLATLSHELRTPLTAILGWAKMLSMGIDPALVATAVETIERSALAQASLVDDLLDLSRIATGKLKLRHELVDLATSVENAVQTLRLAAESREIRVVVEPSRTPALVMGDGNRLQQVIWNLLANAIKFSKPGSTVTLHVDVAAEDVTVRVRDVGMGIAPEFLPHVFEAFRQADAASTRAHGGLGLGLAIVKYLVEHHGGTIAAESDGPGLGAVFIVTLPLAVRSSRTPVLDATESGADLRGLSILVVDDDADTRRLLETILRRFGAEVTVAASVRNACEVLTSLSPHVVVTDIAMPGEDGYALVRHLQETNRNIPAIALTASPDRGEALRDAGFRAHARKPIDPLEFARIIAALR